jgi:formyl-CoA transferase
MWAELADAARHRTTDEILMAAVAESVPLAAVKTLEEFLHDPQVIHNEVFVEYHDPRLGRIRQLNFPIRFSESQVNVDARAPMLGEHTEQVFKDWGKESNAP